MHPLDIHSIPIFIKKGHIHNHITLPITISQIHSPKSKHELLKLISQVVKEPKNIVGKFLDLAKGFHTKTPYEEIKIDIMDISHMIDSIINIQETLR